MKSKKKVLSYEDIFIPREKRACEDIIETLKSNSVIVIGLPGSGKSFILKYIVDNYHKYSERNSTVISLYPLEEKLTLSRLKKKFKYQLSKYFHFEEDLDLEFVIRKVLDSTDELIIAIKDIHTVRNNLEILEFLEKVRGLNIIKIRFIFSSNTFVLNSDYEQKNIFHSCVKKFLPNTSSEYSEKEMKEHLKVLQLRYGWNISDTLINLTLILGGGFPGLTRYIVRFIVENGIKKTISTKEFLKDQTISSRVNQTLDELKKSKLVNPDYSLNLDKSEFLRNLGIINKKNQIRIKLLKSFLSDSNNNVKFQTFLDNLSKQEFELYNLFIESKNSIVNKNDISKRIWGEQDNVKFSQWAIYKLVSTLNKKLESHDLHIKNVRGRGYKLEN